MECNLTMKTTEFIRRYRRCLERSRCCRCRQIKLSIRIQLLSLTAFASMAVIVLGDEPLGPVSKNPTTLDQNALILRILKAVETHDYGALLSFDGLYQVRRLLDSRTGGWN